MTTPSGRYVHVGFRHVTLMEIDTDGYPTVPTAGDTAYAGVRIDRAKALEITVPDVRTIVYSGDDRAFQIDRLPASEEAVTGVLTAEQINKGVMGDISPVVEHTIGEMQWHVHNHDKMGCSSEVILWAYSQGTEDDPSHARYGERVYALYVFPKCYLDPKMPAMNENKLEVSYNVTPRFVSSYPWGLDFSVANNGVTEGQVLSTVCEGEPFFNAFEGDGSTTEFTYADEKGDAITANSVDKITVYVDGVEQTSGITVATTSVTFTAAPAADDNIFVIGEKAECS